MGMKIIPINERDGESLLQFEVENRNFFEQTCMPRGNKYYEEENFRQILKELIIEQKQGIHYMHLIKNQDDKIIGRINLVEVITGNMNKAELGYRIAKEYIGKGYGKKVVELILAEAKNIQKLHRIEASASIENIASQKVLEYNGFRKVGVYNEHIYFFVS